MSIQDDSDIDANKDLEMIKILVKLIHLCISRIKYRTIELEGENSRLITSYSFEIQWDMFAHYHFFKKHKEKYLIFN